MNDPHTQHRPRALACLRSAESILAGLTDNDREAVLDHALTYVSALETAQAIDGDPGDAEALAHAELAELVALVRHVRRRVAALVEELDR